MWRRTNNHIRTTKKTQCKISTAHPLNLFPFLKTTRLCLFGKCSSFAWYNELQFKKTKKKLYFLSNQKKHELRFFVGIQARIHCIHLAFQIKQVVVWSVDLGQVTCKAG